MPMPNIPDVRQRVTTLRTEALALLQEVADKTPATQAQYQDHLRRANEYIQDAKQDVQADPNDEEARRSLMEAYQQKAMLFDMAMDRSLP